MTEYNISHTQVQVFYYDTTTETYKMGLGLATLGPGWPRGMREGQLMDREQQQIGGPDLA